jgi:hypothetical protein
VSVLTGPPAACRRLPGGGATGISPSPTRRRAPRGTRERHPTLAPTSTSASTTKGVILSRVTKDEIDEMLAQVRKPSEKQVLAAYWAGQIADAGDGWAALSKAWSWALGALKALHRRDPEAARAAHWHLSRAIALLASQMPESKFEFRAGMTEAEARQLLLDPWGKQQETAP